MSDHTKAAPPLPPASVDFNRLHDAMCAGAEPDKARDEAVFTETLGAPADDPAAAPDAGGDVLDTLSKAALQQRCRDLGIEFESDANKERLKELLRAHPEGVPSEPNPDIISSTGTDASTDAA